MKKKLLPLFLFLSGMAFGQISISYSDFSDAFAPGVKYLSYMTPINAAKWSVFVGEASNVAQSWDFSTLSLEYVGKSLAIDPSTAPLIDQFPDANSVLYEKTFLSGSDTLNNWNYKQLMTDKFVLHGLSDETSKLLVYDPPAIHALVPLEYGQSWVRGRDSAEIIPGFYTINETAVIVDAFGSMKIPGGEYPCLRLTHTTMTVTVTTMTTDTTWSRSYQFYAKGMREVNVLGIQKEQFNQATVDASGIKISRLDAESGIGQSGSGQSAARLDQNFPNPFSTVTMIGYNLVSGCQVTLKVLDFLGKEITTLVNERQMPGDHEIIFDASRVPGGLYYYQLNTPSSLITKKMTIRK
jgi:hypothetical protein